MIKDPVLAEQRKIRNRLSYKRFKDFYYKVQDAIKDPYKVLTEANILLSKYYVTLGARDDSLLLLLDDILWKEAEKAGDWPLLVGHTRHPTTLTLLERKLKGKTGVKITTAGAGSVRGA